ncbi:hypothetical protein J6590_004757 [Homalodisca vitripennis]|nr:hypothetical protein J6590_004757 [Homalodisca vitripennis]
MTGPVKAEYGPGIDGPSSVYVNIICDRRRTTVPGFEIPVSIRVTDVNDNAPRFINAPYILNISEVTVVGTRVLQAVKTVDADQQGPFSTVQYSVLPGPNSDYFVFINELEGTIVLRKPLDYEALSNFTIGIRAQDQGNPPQYSDTQVHVNVIDADDQNPKFVDERYSAIVPDQATQGTRLRIHPREILAYDQDTAINAAIYYSFNAENSDTRFFEIDRSAGYVIVKRTIPEDELLQPATLVVKATQYDNTDRYALSTLTISRPGTSLKELQFLQSHYFAGVLESVPLNSVLLTVITNRHRDKNLRFWLDNYENIFRVTPSGDIILQKPLDFETQDSYVFQVHCTDGYMNATAQINVSVLNVNDWDPRFRYLQYEFFVPDMPEGQLDSVEGEGLVVGRVEVADGDRGDHVSLTLRGPSARAKKKKKMLYKGRSGNAPLSHWKIKDDVQNDLRCLKCTRSGVFSSSFGPVYGLKIPGVCLTLWTPTPKAAALPITLAPEPTVLAKTASPVLTCFSRTADQSDVGAFRPDLGGPIDRTLAFFD